MSNLTVQARLLVEKTIVSKVVSAALAADYDLTVNDGEEDTIQQSDNHKEILKALFTTDQDTLYLFNDKGLQVGWVDFIYGNDGWDVINDYTLNLEELLKPILSWIDKSESSPILLAVLR